ncbi:MAG TPA: glycoside hydrolase family 2 TIM barrel-domain containing protein [Arsenicitalea sp.]|jgi:beta-galactosidase/beta-glucuronidase|nr:glycoside hydrolase family 2 TIM barrel-domain containing protein [Arsenicitalea sp.]
MTEEAVLHPRPRLTRERWFDLCGAWQFAYDDADEGLDARWQLAPERFDRTITVPFPPEAELSGIGERGFHPVVWYRRTFSQRPDEGGRLLLHFGAVDYRAHVWVNGHLVATHEGGHTPFSADITTSLVEGEEQVVVVRAEDQPEDLTQPRGKQDWLPEPHAIWYHRTTGIWQPVWLEPVANVHITQFHLTPDITRSTVLVETTLNRTLPTGAWLAITLRSGGKVLAAQQVRVTSNPLKSVIHIADAEHGQHRGDLYWTPESPNLITVNAVLLSATGDQLDGIESYFGLRSVGFERGRFLLNDRPYFVRSVLEQGYYPQSHLAAPSADALREEVVLIKSLGFNAVRIHQKVEDPRFLYWCDRLGLLLWGEMANAYDFSPQAVDRFTREWLSVVDRDRSNPCVVTWVPLNESWGVPEIAQRPEQQHYASALYHLTKALDPSRPVISNDGWEHTVSDIWGVHDYTQFAEQLVSRYHTPEAIEAALAGMGPQRKRLLLNPDDERGQPIMITEFGGLSFHPADGEPWFGYATATSAEEYMAMMKALFDAIHDSPELAGYCYTQLTDTLQEKNGLLDQNRQPKLPVDQLRAFIDRPSKAIPSEYLDVARRKAIASSEK